MKHPSIAQNETPVTIFNDPLLKREKPMHLHLSVLSTIHSLKVHDIWSVCLTLTSVMTKLLHGEDINLNLTSAKVWVFIVDIAL